MYAHQVIEGLKNLIGPVNDPYMRTLKQVIDAIPSMAKFHINDSAWMLSFKNDGEEIFSDRYFRLPYNEIYVDYEYTSDDDLKDKIALFCLRKPNGNVTVWFADYVNGTANDKISGWVLSFVYFEINPFTDEVRAYQLETYENISYDVVNDIARGHAPHLRLLRNMILLLNCKNIRCEVHQPPEKLNRSRLRKNKLPLLSYKTLYVSNKSLQGGDNQELGNHNRVHLCRGHFKEYTQEHPLLGKHIGLYWWQPHVRGQNKDGVVMKDYNIRPIL